MVLFKEKIQHFVGYRGWRGKGVKGEGKELNEEMPCANFR